MTHIWKQPISCDILAAISEDTVSQPLGIEFLDRMTDHSSPPTGSR